MRERGSVESIKRKVVKWSHIFFALHLGESKNSLKKDEPSQLSVPCDKRNINQCHKNNQHTKYFHLVKTTHFLRSCIVDIFGRTHFIQKKCTTLHLKNCISSSSANSSSIQQNSGECKQFVRFGENVFCEQF